jgi:hypothetical protein
VISTAGNTKLDRLTLGVGWMATKRECLLIAG